ncbi:unnamed protein product [Tuber aestivum]|uniref:Prefoldin subunit 4 n=1 Tax=Tuber aestivum TaxID=59557 RepID=A0A292Q738_9PEZI|nr:unnamed protein product [Tuber aestivum]
MNRRMLSREDESTTEVTVTREDQDRINKFSTLHQKQGLLKDELEKKSQEKEYIEDVSNELELADEDDLIPFLTPPPLYQHQPSSGLTLIDYARYKIGDSFFHLPLEEAMHLLEASKEEVGKEVEEIAEKMEANEGVMNSLKVDLYAKFGKAINLEV